MIKNKNYLNPQLCKECGGTCCKRMPGECFPKDFGEPLLENLIEAFESGNWAIDWWEGDPRKNEDELEEAYYIRPKIKGVNKLFDPTWGGECIFLDKKGCVLSPEKRPISCKLLEPKPKGKGCVNHNGIGKRGAALAWLPFTNIILEASREYKNMKINKIRSGQIFAIEGTKSYPKLKLDIGYIDMRDEILNRHDGILRALEVQLMTDSEVNRVFKKYNMSTKDWKDLRKRLLEKYNPKE